MAPPLTPPLQPPLEPPSKAARWRAAIGSIAVILAGTLGYQVADFGEQKPATIPIPCSCTCVFPNAVPTTPVEAAP